MHNFGVDWKLLAAQGLNFFILFFILRQFVYRPILGILKKRRHEIEKGLEFTRTAEENLKNAEAIKAETLKDAKANALALMTKAQNDANDRKDELIREATLKRDSVVGEAKVIIEEHKNKMLEGVYSSAEGLVKTGLEKVLGRMPASERDRELIKDALKELRHYTTKS